jgi:hypothetical protein
MRKELKNLLFCGLFAAFSAEALAQGISITASYSEANLDWLYAPEHIESACGGDLFAVENTVTAARRVCLRRDVGTGRYEVVASALIEENGWFQVLRGPVAADRGILLWLAPSIVRYDPVTDARSELVRFANPEPITTTKPLIFDREGDGQLEALVFVSGATEIRSMSTGLNLATLTGAPWNAAGLTLVPGRFDADPAAELAVFEPVGMRVYDAVTLQVQGATIVTNGVQTPQVLGPLDWDADGRDEFVYFSSSTPSFALVDFDAPTVPRFVFGPAGSDASHMRAVQWAGDARPELAFFWTARGAVYDPRTDATLAQEDIDSDSRPHQLLGFDDQSAGAPALLWNTPNRLMRWGQGTLPTPTQEALRQVLALRGPVGASGTDAELLTGETRAHVSGSAFSWFSRRNASTLRPQQTSLIDVFEPAAMNIGDARVEPGDELLSHNPTKVVVGNLGNSTLWGIDLSSFSNERVGRSATAQFCAGVACNRVLVGYDASSSGSAGSYLALYDAQGATLWTGAPDNCLGCSFRAVALDDVDGDGAPDLLSAKFELSPVRDAVVLRDGLTRAARWTRDFPFALRVRHLAVAGDDQRRVMALIEDGGTGPVTLNWLDSNDGSTRRARTVPSTVQRIAYLPYSASRGAWLLLGDPATVWVIDADLRGGIRALSIDEVEHGGAGEFGAAYLASRHTVHRASVLEDTLLIDGFEDF